MMMRRASAAEVLPFVERAAKFDTTGGNLDLQAIARNGKAFVFTEDDVPVLGYTLEVRGREVWITAAAGRSGVDLTAKGLAAIEAQATGFDAIVFETVRRGLVKKAARHGFEVAGTIPAPGRGYIMRKAIK